MCNMPEVIISRIKECAKQKGITQTHLCKQIGKRATFFNEVNHGKDSIDETEICKIAEFLEVSPKYLLGETDDPTPQDSDDEISTEDEELLALFKKLTSDKKETLKKLIEQMSERE